MSEPELIPFGKYRGMPVEAVLEDRQYAEWLIAQGWFRERYQNLYITIQNGGSQPDMTPEHNRMQARFLNEEYARKFLCFILSKTKFSSLSDRIKILPLVFECDGWDVLIPFVVGDLERHHVFVELKPSISDDFPAVLRQVKSRMSLSKSGRGYPVVLCDYFDHAASVCFSDVKKMFSPGVLLIQSSDFE